MRKSICSFAALVLTCLVSSGQAPTPKFPPEVLERKASMVGIKTEPAGGTVKVDGVAVPRIPFMLLKTDKPRVLRFELAGYKPIEKALEPGQHYVIGIGVDFIRHKVYAAESDQPPTLPGAAGNNGATPASMAEPASQPAESETAPVAAPEPVRPDSSSQKAPTPFGFEFGMTKEQAIQKLGKSAVVKDSGVNVVFNTAPSPHPDFEAYIVSFSAQKGLLKITALSKNVETSDDGAELRSKFQYFLSALRDKYGKADKDFDFCKSSDVECRSEYFMMTLKEKNRYLNSFWTTAKAHLPPHLDTIGIDAIALGMNKGYVEVAYEFEGWNNFVDEQDKKRNSTF